MHKNGQNLKKNSPAAQIGTAGTKFLFLIRANNVKFSIYESKIQKFFACGANGNIFGKKLHFSCLCPPRKKFLAPPLALWHLKF